MGKETRRPAVDIARAIEHELRLTGEAETLQAVFNSQPLASRSDGAAEVDLVNRYVDTPDHRLHTRGLALRIRKDARGCRQTLKAGDDAHGALLKRGEWEVPLDEDRLDLDALPKPARRLIVKTVSEGDLTTAFETTYRRRTRRLTVDGPDGRAEIEAALDLGVIEAEGASLPIAEIELELLEGELASLYDLALELQDGAPLRIETRSKSNRAFSAITGKAPAWHKATTPDITPDDTVDQAMAAIFESCFAQWLANQAAAVDGRDPEGVHQMRVGLRRLRSTLSIFKKLIPKRELDWLRADARQTADYLGPARDWDVFLNDLLAPVMHAQPEDRELSTLCARAKTRRAAAYRALRKNLLGAPYNRFLLRFGAWLEGRAWRQARSQKQAALGELPVTAFTSELLSTRQGKALQQGEGFADLPVGKRHALRIALKKLRYALEFFAPLFQKTAVKPFVGSLKTLQNDLGHLNDVAVARTLLDDLTAKPGKTDLRRAAGMVIGWHARGVADLEPKLIRDWSAFARRSPFWA
ncbi:MAG: CHAD domain-containing protein [Alphaproteobacteria bacterium]